MADLPISPRAVAHISEEIRRDHPTHLGQDQEVLKTLFLDVYLGSNPITGT